MKKILLVCTGNTCRSSMAQGILTQILAKQGFSDQVQVASAGTHTVFGLPASPEAVRVLREIWNLDLSRHQSTPLSSELVATTDLILTLSAEHRDYLLSLVPEVADKTFVLSDFAGAGGRGVSDPIGSGPDEYRRVAEEIAGYLEQASPRIIEFLGLKGDV